MDPDPGPGADPNLDPDAGLEKLDSMDPDVTDPALPLPVEPAHPGPPSLPVSSAWAKLLAPLQCRLEAPGINASRSPVRNSALDLEATLAVDGFLLLAPLVERTRSARVPPSSPGPHLVMHRSVCLRPRRLNRALSTC
ncbi:hypothetical protein GNI_175930 [Gregarina niphandrodes]|uniref:Uncharacterized protein n=1 Tax=Gregarina niphandrodes TaxID=110365 RepID=A0A023AXB8_GRENI|nr:hypothetical protein GNI_175930 [Gregarina niphandrodes]EZG43359.1 hypothetical protein GNI_175930 [Gregarina niphandrodes]|eukprot:XP_011134668.1 hypothetical protein GNI_175930 [Gregarina niphandrodes]